MWYYIILGVVLVVVILLMQKLLRPDNSKAARLMRTYRHLTVEQLRDLNDADIVTAVVSNLLAKAEAERRDPYVIIPNLSNERCAVYSVWLFMKQLATDDPAALRQKGQFGFSELAADALDFLNKPELAAVLRDYLQTADESAVPVMREMVEKEQLPMLLAELIREDPAAFCDE